MGRQARKLGISGTYHIIQRGIDKNLIFFDEMDFKKYLDILDKNISECKYELYAYCLMHNHIHLLVHTKEEAPGLLVQKVSISYSQYFNKKYDRVGHLFQNRFKSEPVEDDKYLLAVVKYIHNNPKSTGVFPVQNYKWSSYHEYLESPKLVQPDFVLDLLGGRENFISFMMNEESNTGIEYLPKRLSDPEALQILKEVTGEQNTLCLQKMDIPLRNAFISEILSKGVSTRQLARLTGLSKSTIQRAR